MANIKLTKSNYTNNIGSTVVNPYVPVPSKVNALEYGIKTIKGATDLVLDNVLDHSVITYDQANNNFILQTFQVNSVAFVDGGNY